MKQVTKELCETLQQCLEHLWGHAKYIIQNQTGPNGYPAHNYGIISGNTLIDANLLEWWCTLSDTHGYGIFHLHLWDSTTNSYVVVSLTLGPL